MPCLTARALPPKPSLRGVGRRSNLGRGPRVVVGTPTGLLLSRARLNGAHTIPLAPFLSGRGKISKALEGHPPDLLPEGAIPSGRPLWAGGHPQTPAIGRCPLDSCLGSRAPWWAAGRLSLRGVGRRSNLGRGPRVVVGTPSGLLLSRARLNGCAHHPPGPLPFWKGED